AALARASGALAIALAGSAIITAILAPFLPSFFASLFAARPFFPLRSGARGARSRVRRSEHQHASSQSRDLDRGRNHPSLELGRAEEALGQRARGFGALGNELTDVINGCIHAGFSDVVAVAVAGLRLTRSCWAMPSRLLTNQYSTRPAGN